MSDAVTQVQCLKCGAPQTTVGCPNGCERPNEAGTPEVQWALHRATKCGHLMRWVHNDMRPCALPKDHPGEHKWGAKCYTHGDYVGDQCPGYPHCRNFTVQIPAKDWVERE
jgi:hypothetical protein